MTHRFFTAVGLLALASNAIAQSPGYPRQVVFPGSSPVVISPSGSQVISRPLTQFPSSSGPIFVNPSSPILVNPVSPQFPQFLPPSQPVVVTPSTPTDINPLTGGIDTSSTQIDSSAFDPGRTQSMNNGTMRQVDRPIYDTSGNVVGRQTGVEWYNPQTGRWHGELNNATLNGMGGVNNQTQFRSGAPGKTSPTQPSRPGTVTPLPNNFRPNTVPPLPNGFRPRS